MKSFGAITFTPAVQALQMRHGSRDAYARMQENAVPEGGLGPRETEFIAAADSFYMATVGATGWPYVQHRGGPRGFLRAISPRTIAFPDFRGNRQYVSVGNAAGDDRVSIIVVDYPGRRRLKLLGRMRFEDAEGASPDIAQVASIGNYRARVERVAVIDVEAFDWNCPQHITQRFTLDEVEAASAPLRERIARLEAELAGLRGRPDDA